MILDNRHYLFVLGTEIIKHSWMPEKIRRLNQAVQDFQTYMAEIYESEKHELRDSKPVKGNLMTHFIRASLGPNGLSETEIYGNIFLSNFAGHDTTSHTLTFAIYLLATQHSIQMWIAEELDIVFGTRSFEEWNYTNDFPKLKRVLALLYETLRLYIPVPIAKSTGDAAKTMTVNGKSFIILQNTLVIPNHIAVHTHLKIWANDSLDFKPQRWIKPSLTSSIVEETLLVPRKGTFVAWSEGVRNCPGKKFSQVEFVATLAGLLW